MVSVALHADESGLTGSAQQMDRLARSAKPDLDLRADGYEPDVRSERLDHERVALVTAVVTDALTEQAGRDADDGSRRRMRSGTSTAIGCTVEFASRHASRSRTRMQGSRPSQKSRTRWIFACSAHYACEERARHDDSADYERSPSLATAVASAPIGGQVEAHAADRHAVVRDAVTAALRGGQQARTIDGDELQSAEPFSAAVPVFSEPDRRVVQSQRRIRLDRPIEDLVPARRELSRAPVTEFPRPRCRKRCRSSRPPASSARPDARGRSRSSPPS